MNNQQTFLCRVAINKIEFFVEHKGVKFQFQLCEKKYFGRMEFEFEDICRKVDGMNHMSILRSVDLKRSDILF